MIAEQTNLQHCIQLPLGRDPDQGASMLLVNAASCESAFDTRKKLLTCSQLLCVGLLMHAYACLPSLRCVACSCQLAKAQSKQHDQADHEVLVQPTFVDSQRSATDVFTLTNVQHEFGAGPANLTWPQELF